MTTLFFTVLQMLVTAAALRSFPRKWGKVAGWVAVASAFLALVVTAKDGIQVHSFSLSFPWMTLGKDLVLSWDFALDPLSRRLAPMVTLSSLLIQIYSLEYLKHSSRRAEYFSYLSLFTASMLGLLYAQNLLLFFCFWELMGFCSYLLIGFDLEKESANRASLKAFLTTRIGDAGLLLGIVALFSLRQSVAFDALSPAAFSGLTLFGWPAAEVLVLLLFLGTVGKSAQMPLQSWLPDAMAGPTPVSALIHAATMVVAGVILLLRIDPLFSIAPDATLILMGVGSVTSLGAAMAAGVQTDLKRLLAYSTISQLGLLVAGISAGGARSSIIHITTHAFAKAGLFLIAGILIHLAHSQNIADIRVAKKDNPIVFGAFLLFIFSLTGIPGFGGFYSKEGILQAIWSFGHRSGHLTPAVLCTGGIFFTAFYLFRLCWEIFFRASKGNAQAEPASRFLIWPLAPLAVLSLGIWYHEPLHFDSLLVGSLLLILLGVVLSRWLKVPNVKFRVDSLYEIFPKVLTKQADALNWFDEVIIDRLAVDGWSRVCLWLRRLAELFDNVVIDRFLVDGSGRMLSAGGFLLTRIQNGRVQSYLLWTFGFMGAGLVIWLIFP